eukprot:CAMPEP_0172572494 /NCGR_PEP_ID=MMETSP1067-20121228/135313_1 /TAXON_ID=265564 ORGANISM="Thalassiosira punctigera, Strain Tpunct2005C2" /NCGR_SAMPLE_ID=MMETSP1067 /ASSEMBLY_ACC=CAM_ASM_000444 /LENGTH=173 /DNA_ID=CAMNT_0013365045 /DNA_START=63 /DNA_END=584 /DNA_ORIENTATION=+
MAITIGPAAEDDLGPLRDFHVSNHLDETCHCPGEREHQIGDLKDDFPQLYSAEVFRRGSFRVATAEPGGKILGCVGLVPDEEEPDEVTWLNTFSVSREVRGRGVGSELLRWALGAVETGRVRLVTLGGHSEGKDVMGVARSMYEKSGFALYKKSTVKYGDSTTIDVLYYEKIM